MARSGGIAAVLILLLNVLTIGAFFLFAWNATNMAIQHTYLLPPDAPGTLISERTGVFYYLHQAVLAATLFLILLAALTAQQPNGGYNVLYVIFTLLYLGLVWTFFGFYIVEREVCNAPGGGSPFCNDERWCCVYGGVSPGPVVASCPYLLSGCAPALAPGDLNERSTFTFGFVTTIALGVLALLHFIAGIIICATGPSMRSNGRSSSSEPTTDMFTDEETITLEGDIGQQIGVGNNPDFHVAMVKRLQRNLEETTASGQKRK